MFKTGQIRVQTVPLRVVASCVKFNTLYWEDVKGGENSSNNKVSGMHAYFSKADRCGHSADFRSLNLISATSVSLLVKYHPQNFFLLHPGPKPSWYTPWRRRIFVLKGMNILCKPYAHAHLLRASHILKHACTGSQPSHLSFSLSLQKTFCTTVDQLRSAQHAVV